MTEISSPLATVVLAGGLQQHQQQQQRQERQFVGVGGRY